MPTELAALKLTVYVVAAPATSDEGVTTTLLTELPKVMELVVWPVPPDGVTVNVLR